MKNDESYSSPNDSSEAYIFRPYITLQDGTRLYAKAYGHKAFRIPVGEDN